jgi:hypothetical protein
VIEQDEVQGEMPWRTSITMNHYRRDDNGIGIWRCVECEHPPEDHYDDPYDTDPWFECSKCNCGNNSR